MTFEWPSMLWLILLTPLLVVVYFQLLKRRSHAAARFGSLGLLQSAQAGRKPGLRRHIPAFLFLVGFLILMGALARPHMEISLPRIEGIVILAFDTSGSMAAQDLKPTRMEAARAIAQEFVARQPLTVQIGIVAFSDSGFSIQQPTNDPTAIVSALERLAPQRSTSLATGISVALDTIAKFTGQTPEDPEDFPPELLPEPAPLTGAGQSSASIVLISDGENTTNPDPLVAAQAAAALGVRIHTIGIGSPQGADLEVDGFTIHTQLDSGMLQEIAALTGGGYYAAASEEDMTEIYQQIEPKLVIRSERTEITAIFAAASLVFFLAGSLLSLLWFGRIP